VVRDIEEKQSWRDDYKHRDSASLTGLRRAFAAARNRFVSVPRGDFRSSHKLRWLIHGMHLLSTLKSRRLA